MLFVHYPLDRHWVVCRCSRKRNLMDRCVWREGLHCALGIQEELSRGQTVPSSLPFPALSASPPSGPRMTGLMTTPRWSPGLLPYLLQGWPPSGEGTAAVQLLAAVRCPLPGRKEPSVMGSHPGSPSRSLDPRAWPWPPAAEPNPAQPFRGQILPYQQVRVSISKFTWR